MARKIIDTLLFLLVAGVCVLLTLATAGGNLTSLTTIYNFAFLGVMALLYLIALFAGFFRMSDMTEYFRSSADKIDRMETTGRNASLEENVKSLGTYRPVQPSLDRFLQDLRKTHSGLCDIEDYINDEEADSAVHRRVLSMLPDILTSLGILGTFMGLVWGLRAFQPSSYEAMTASVTSLVDGIKVAFLTSIYGLMLSLTCSYSLRSGYQSMTDALHQFLDRFHTRLVPSAEMETQNLIVNNQREQNDLIRALTAEFSDQVAHGFAASMAPTLDRINTQLGDMMSTISNNQQLFLQDIVNSFVKEMKKEFHMEFSEFGETLKSMNDLTNRNIQYYNSMYKEMSDDMRALFAKDEEEMRAIVKDMTLVQRDMTASAEAVTKQFELAMQNTQKAQDTTLKNLTKSEQESARFWVACNQAMQNYLKTAASAYDRFQGANEASDKMLTAMTAIYQKNEKALEDYQKRVKEFQDTQKKMNQTLEEISRLFYQVEVAGSDGKTMYFYPGLSAQSKESEQRMMRRIEEALQESEERQSDALDAVRREVKNLNEKKKSRWFGI